MKVIAIDNLLWDIFEGGTKKAGGAGANFIYNLAQVGADATIISAIGKDSLGNELKAVLNQHNIQHYLQENEYPTSTVDANVDKSGVPHWTIHENIAWDYILPDDRLLQLSQSADLIYFGTLTQRSETSRKTIQQMILERKLGAKTFVDVNIRQHYYSKEILEFCINNASYLKVSDEEMPVVAKALDLPENPNNFFAAIKDKVELFIFTKGSDGSSLYRGGEVSHHHGFEVKVKDTVGAGDSFSAAVCALALKGLDLDTINHFANSIASYTCQKEGGMNPIPFLIL
ncbi:MAG: PfkB family carbohydrate kinase [Alphaproteobacteria bacterium]